MKVLVACEFSGIVRDAFIARGHNAVSCDLLPTERPGPHIQGDVLEHLNEGWDLMIAHPPCTYLCNSGVRWLYNGHGSLNQERWQKMKEAAEFFRTLWCCSIPKICIENPVMHKHGKCYAGIVFVHDMPEFKQVVQPWMFGEGETKATCLWRRNLPPLVPTNIVSGRIARVHREPPSPERWKNRSRTYPGLAAAMADQWGCPK